MELDLMFVSAVLAEGKPALRHALECGVTVEALTGRGAEAFEFIVSYLKEYGDAPSADIVFGKTGIPIEKVEGKAAFFALEVMNRQLHLELIPKIRDWADMLEKAKPRDLVADAEITLRRIRQEYRTARVESLTHMGVEVWEDYQRMKAGVWGIELPWPTINEATLGMWSEDLILFVARVGIGKCNSFDSLVMDTVTGVPYTIQSICDGTVGVSQTATWSKGRGVYAAPITAKLNSGLRECIRVRLVSGREVRVTPEHPLLTPEGWKRADSVGVGATLALPASMPHPSKPQGLPAAEVDLLALMLTDGCCTTAYPTYTKDDCSLVEIARAAAQAFGVRLHATPNLGTYSFVRETRTGENPVTGLLRRHGIFGKKSPNKTLPDAIFRLPAEQLGRFLSVFWMSDGYATDGGVEIMLASKELISQLQSLLLRFGIQSRMIYKLAKYQNGEKDAWKLRVLAESYEAFAEHISLWGEKAVTLAALIAKDRNPNVGSPRISEALKQKLKALSSTGAGRWNGGLHEKVAAQLGWKKFETRNLFGQDNAIQLTAFKAFCDVYGVTEEYRWWWDSDIFWDVVESIEPIGPQQTYDLSMPPTECFVANDVIVHNSWAGLIIAKHVWQKGKRVLFVTTEMARLNIARRFVALHLKLPFTQFRRGQLGEFVEKKVEVDLKALAEQEGFYIIGGDFNFTFEDLEAAIDEAEPDLLIVDGAYLMKAQGVSRTERAAAAFDELKRVGKRRKIPVIATSQFNRDVKNNASDTISLDRIALTDTASWNADVVIAINRTEDMRRDNQAELRLLKSRESNVGDPVMLRWDFNTMCFDEMPKTGGGDADEFGTGMPTGTGAPGEPTKSDPFGF